MTSILAKPKGIRPFRLDGEIERGTYLEFREDDKFIPLFDAPRKRHLVTTYDRTLFAGLDFKPH